ncbi:hypothetical protein EMIHUDRAFT_241949 [Emiliania huxleyi CCMP1516]|uniref:AP2/ERF domain-containing protein n=2 Tax=Emiliania huxleyi TaxID=2903 RepID=A0A0D3JB37_EMIH1|nr:hypothetical protein EMIHUDRAFT_241949 [Emiliania huxleyi CCMP1516]EOD20722.1 hypothetical protein EMIHUDRAFT_241949 [Emiliania huxleyi CCMP1516]|eukprot:XP_005773151.1 hypothetical protein EMIHUDRAFT_241949 [Emiliania huxleyi CCMP1516]
MSNDGDKHAGLRLHLSSSCSTGYKCVYEHFGRFQAKRWVDGKEVCLGTFATAVEAAAAYARAVGGFQPPPPTVVTESEGLRLHLSTSNTTGYAGVTFYRVGQYHARTRVDGRKRTLGVFDSPVEAAVAYARAVGDKRRRPEDEDGDEAAPRISMAAA